MATSLVTTFLVMKTRGMQLLLKTLKCRYSRHFALCRPLLALRLDKCRQPLGGWAVQKALGVAKFY